MQDLISLLEKKQTPKKVKECLSASHGESSVNTVTFPARKQLITPKGENKPLILKKQRRQGPRKSPAARGLLIGLYFITKLLVNLHSAVQFFSVLHIAGQKCATAHISHQIHLALLYF